MAAEWALGVAGQPAHALQPGVGRPVREAVVGAQAVPVVGRGRRPVDRARRARLPGDDPPDYRPPDGAEAEDAVAGTDPFIMQGDGLGWLFAPSGLVDGPLPTHYEPHESPVANPLYAQQSNPVRKEIARRGNRYNPTAGRPGADVFPYVITTYRLTEHHTAGGMSRFLAYLSELQPAPICEVGPELAAERGLVHGDWATIVTARSAIEARVLVTDRMPALRVGGRRIHQVGLPYHWGQKGLVTGDSANDLLGLALDPNVVIQESKAGTCDVRPGRRPRGPALPRLVADYRRRAGLEVDEDAADQPRVGFFTDTSICIGCKACEVACKEWNGVPDDGFDFLGQSYDNTGELGADTWRHVAFIEQKRPAEAAESDGGVPVADELGRVQALHVGRLPRRVPHRRAVAHRVRHRGRAVGRLQRVRLLRPGLPVRRDRPAPGRRPGLEVHHLLRPAAGRPGAGLRHRLPHPVDPVRAARRAAGPGRGPGGHAARGRRDRGPPVRRRPRRRRRRHGRLLPPPRRPRGLRPAARPGRHHPRPAVDVALGRGRRRDPGRRRGRRLRPPPPMTPPVRVCRNVG